MEKIINYAYKREVSKSFKGSYSFTNKRFSKFIENFLLKHGFIKKDEVIEVHYDATEVDLDASLNKIIEYCEELHFCNFNMVEKFIIGRKQAKLLSSAYFESSVNLGNFPFRQTFSGGYQMFDIPVEINPYIDGIVPVIKENI